MSGVERGFLERSDGSLFHEMEDADDVRASRDLKFGAGKNARAVTLGLDAFNVLNRVNYGGYVGTIGSPLFGQPVVAQPGRQLQFSARMKF